MTKITYIPGEIANAAIDEHGNREPVTRTQHIFDDAKGKSQAEVNADIDNALALHQSEINALDSQNYATVGTFSELPATGSVDTIYRVSNWDGSANSGAGAVDATVYSEYAWDDSNSEYKLLDVKTAVGEVFDISLYHASGGVLAEYADLTSALGTNGANVPADIRRGGMSVKFVQSPDHKYERYNLLATSFTTDITQWAIDDAGVYVDNPEFVYVKTDNEGKILWAIKTDGSIYYGAGVPQQVIDYINEKIAELSLDEYEDIVAFLDDLEKGDKTLQTLFNEKVDKEEGKSLIDEEVSESLSAIEDPEGRSEITTDAEGKIISYRDSDGVKHEEVGIETNSLKLSADGMTEFQQALRDSGFQPGGFGDYTDKISMQIAEPRLAHLNIIGNVVLENLSKEGMAGAIEGVNYNVPVQVEFTDGKGNYFKKYALLSGQGRSSLNYVKKGLGFDFFNENPEDENFNEDNTFSMKFGDWVYQDSFHVKSFYTDWPRCTTPITYKLMDEVLRTRGLMEDRTYKKYYVGDYTDAANGQTEPKDFGHNFETGARCIPDGFPVIVYHNGEFWGVNAWQLKKHRDNYQLSKKKADNVHLDGDFSRGVYAGLNHDPFWLWNGVIDWTVYCHDTVGIETRNPKNLYCIDGKKYNVDTHNKEIVDTATAEAWITAGVIPATGKVIDDELAGYLRTTGKVRKNIEDLTTYIPTIRQMAIITTSDGDISIGSYGGEYSAEGNFSKGVWVSADNRQYMSIHTTNTGHDVTDTEYWHDITDALADVKAAIEDRFDVNSFIDYIVLNNVIENKDAWDNNGQIITWGKLGESANLNWSVNAYDCDYAFGSRFDGRYATAATNEKWGDELLSDQATYPVYKIFWDYYFVELRARYIELREAKIFDANHITQMFRDWMDRVGYDFYKKEYEKWPQSPCFYYNGTNGYYGSIYRIYLWIKKRIEFMDAANFFNYNN